MIAKTAAYDAAIVADSRKIYPRVVFDLFDPDATVGAVTTSGATQMSRHEQVTKRGSDESNDLRLSVERNRWLLNGDMRVPTTAAARTGQVGWEGVPLSDNNGRFSSPYPWLEQRVSNVEILQAVTLQFSGHPQNGVPTEFTVDVWSGGALIASVDVVPDPEELFCAVEGFEVYAPERIRVTVKRWSLPGRRPRLVRFMMGLYEIWGGKELAAVDIYTEVTFSGLAIPYSTCSLAVHNEDHRFDPYAPGSIFKSIEERQAIQTELGVRLEDGTIEYLPTGTYFQQSGGWELRDLTVEWKLVDIIGMLVKRKFITPATLPTTLAGWLTALTGSLGVNFRTRYTVDDDIADLPLTAAREDVDGKTCGELLRFLCMATNTWPRQDMPTGNLHLSKLERLEGNRITLDNMTAYPTMEANDDIADLTFALDNGSVTFPGTNTNSEVSLQINNPFVHTTEDARRAAVSAFYEYGGRAFQVIHRGNPSSEAGDLQTVDTQFGSTLTARLYRQQLKLEKGVMRRVPSYLVQSPNDATYQHKVILTGTGTWTAPEGVTALKITVIGAGNGGQGGRGGRLLRKDGINRNVGGAGGEAGRVFVIEITTNAGQNFPYRCGAGGVGGTAGGIAQDGGNGGEGGATTFGGHTSAAGRRYDNGLMDIQTGVVYALPGVHNGGRDRTTYGSGGAGGRNGDNGLIVEELDGNTINEYVASEPEPGEPGSRGLDGCVILEY